MKENKIENKIENKKTILTILASLLILSVVFFMFSNKDISLTYKAKDMMDIPKGEEVISYLPEKEKSKVKVKVVHQENIFRYINSEREEKDFALLDVNTKLQNVAYLSNINTFHHVVTGDPKYAKNGYSVLKKEGFLKSHEVVLEQHIIRAANKTSNELLEIFKGKIEDSDILHSEKVKTFAVSVMTKDSKTYYLSYVYSYN